MRFLRHSLDFNTFSFIQEDLSKTFGISTNERGGDLISGGNQFCRKSELFGAPFCISILGVLWTKILRHSLDFKAFCMI